MGDKKLVVRIEIVNQHQEKVDGYNVDVASSAFVNGWRMMLKLDGVSIKESQSLIELLRKVEELKELNKDILFKWE